MKKFINLLLIIMVTQSATPLYGMRALQSARRVAAHLPAMRAMAIPVQSGLRLAHTQQSTAVKTVPHVARITAAHQKTLAMLKVAQNKKHTSFFSGLFGKIAAGLASIFGWFGFATDQKAQCEKSVQTMPAFTVENIKEHPEFKKAFIEYAKAVIPKTLYQDPYKASGDVWPICGLIETYPEVVSELLPIILQKFAGVNRIIIELVLTHSPESAPQIARCALETVAIWQLSCILDSPWHNYYMSGTSKRFLKDDIIKLALEGIDNIPSPNIDIIYKHLDASQKSHFEKLVAKKFGKQRLHITNALNPFYPPVLGKEYSGSESYQATVSEGHFRANCEGALESVHSLLGLYSYDPRAMQVLRNVYHKEQQETAKGNTVAYHSSAWGFDHCANIYKRVHNLCVPTKSQVGNDFVFMRFDKSSTGWSMAGDVIYANLALYGNALVHGDDSVGIFFNDRPLNNTKHKAFSSLSMMQKFGLEAYHEQHRMEFAELERLHQAANPQGYNRLLLFVCNDKQLAKIRMAQRDGGIRPIDMGENRSVTNMQSVVHAYKHMPTSIDESNDTKVCIPTEILKDPQTSPRILRYHAADPVKMKEYEQRLDQLFAKIKAEMVADGVKLPGAAS